MKITFQDLFILQRACAELANQKAFGLELAINISRLDEVSDKFKASQKKINEGFKEFVITDEKVKNMRATAKADKKEIAWIYKKKFSEKGSRYDLVVFTNDNNEFVISNEITRAKYHDKDIYESFFVNPDRFDEYTEQTQKLINEVKEEFEPYVIEKDEVKAFADSKGLNAGFVSILMKYGIIEK